MSEPTSGSELHTLSFEAFWSWLQLHLNCVLRAGSSDAVIFDDEDLHWHFGQEDADTYLVQVIRGKHMFAELVLRPSEVAYVQSQPMSAVGPPRPEAPLQDEDRSFDLIGTSGGESLFQFVMAHDYEEESAVAEAEPGGPGRWTH